ncbi:hypothetical protein FZC73_16875 [Enterobacter hormaechei]|nr:hypothetical protein [Enterobacter hormaechei]MBY5220141.1 hypothetical protein [Enterobacter hormaechei]MBY5223096.1 hypothetical protein [Enterobacter hormaechei]TYR92543.1 hypothetical protein FZC73_16875 [Enterobacter hormaechei]TYS98694.1 hypothetical protein FYK60_10290 [Enterobacter hormaechei]
MSACRTSPAHGCRACSGSVRSKLRSGTYQSLCRYLLRFSGKKQNIPSKRKCHLFRGQKPLSGEPRSHIITIS